MNPLSFSLQCNEIVNLNIKALYQLQDTVLVSISDTGKIAFKVFDKNWDSIGVAGNYYLAPDDYLHVLAINTEDDDNAYIFDSFQSNISAINNATGYFVNVTNGGVNINIWTHWDEIPKDDCEKFACAYVIGDLECDKTDVATITPSDGCISTSYNETDVTFTCSIKPEYSECYGIKKVIVGQGNDVEYDPSTTKTVSYTLRSKCSKPKISFVVVPVVNLTLTLYTDLDKTTELTDPDDDTGIGLDKDVTIEYIIKDDCGVIIYSGQTSESPNPLIWNDLKCGYQVILTPKWDLREEGFDFVEWDDSQGYYYPSPNTTKIFSFTIFEDKVVKGKFIEHFRLRKIGFYTEDDHANIKWFTTKELKNKIPTDVEVWNFNTSEETGYRTRIHYKFNDRVNTNSLDRNIIISDLSERIDLPFFKRPDIKYSYPIMTETSYYADEGSSKQFRQDIFNPVVGQILKGELFEISVGAGNTLFPLKVIKNTKNYNLFNPGKFNAETELPGLIGIWRKMECIESSGDGGVEMSTIWNSLIIGAGNSEIWRNNQSDNNITHYMSISDPPGDVRRYPSSGYYTEQVVKYPKMYKDYLYQIATVSFDIDELSETDYNRIKEIFYFEYKGFIFIPVWVPCDPETCDPLNPQGGNWQLIPIWVEFDTGFVGKFINMLLKDIYKNAPDHIGAFRHVFTWDNKWFGAHPSLKKNYDGGNYFKYNADNKMKYWIDYQLLKKQNGSDETYIGFGGF